MFAFHPPNGGYRRPVEAAILQAMGVVAGVPDVIAIKDGRVYGLELKREGAHPTLRQTQTMEVMQAAGAAVAVARGLDEALSWLERWGLIRPDRGVIDFYTPERDKKKA